MKVIKYLTMTIRVLLIGLGMALLSPVIALIMVVDDE